jgi:ribonuclease HII
MLTVGIDEVGRGCWAGPVAAAAVILGNNIPGLKDSKKLSAPQRECLAAEIKAHALAIGIGWTTPQEVDQLGLTEAVRKAMQRALAEITLSFDEIIIDGSFNFFPSDLRAKAIIKADDSVACVSAASIIAKVARDDYMRAQALLFPKYGFQQHFGYGTKLHLAMLQQFGTCELHRLSYKPVQAINRLIA